MPADESAADSTTHFPADPEANPPVTPAGRTRWRRFGLALLGSGVLAGILVGLTAQGVLAAQFSISGTPFTVTAKRLDGTGFEQFATLDSMPDNSPNAGDTGGQLVLIVSAIDEAKLDHLCQSIALGGTNIRITAGDAGTPVTAKTLVVDSDAISGNAEFGNIQVGVDAIELTATPGVKGNLGVFSQQADRVVITNLRQNNFATTAATFNLPHLRIAFSDKGC